MVLPNGSLSSYRNLSGQVLLRRQWCAQGKCQNAAVPGTSNHGWGLAVDANNPAGVQATGRPFGWQKQWSDAPWEPWHFKWAGFGSTTGGSPKPRQPDSYVIRKGRNIKAVRTLKVLLRDIGFLPENMKINSIYGLKCRKAVRRFQRERMNIKKPDGVVGPKTWAALRRASQHH